jgi:hypothetical protein
MTEADWLIRLTNLVEFSVGLMVVYLFLVWPRGRS